MRFVLPLLAALPLLAQAADPVWLQIAPGGKLLARTVVDRQCPNIVIDGKPVTMQPRTGSAKSDEVLGFRLACQAEVTTARTASIGGVKLNLPEGAPKRILVLGDTGCRIKAESDSDHDDGAAGKVKVQDCNSAKGWPFAQVAAAAAAEKPDLIIHVGDYLYRESACPPGYGKDCEGSPWGDNWQTWDADFFSPAEELLKSAPWVFVRGNHEICSRAGSGWNYYLDGAAFSQTCSDHDAPWAVKLGPFQAWVIDSSAAPDDGPTNAKEAEAAGKDVTLFAKEFKAAGAEHFDHAWLLSHRPIWGVKAGSKGQRDQLRTLNETLQQAWALSPITSVDLVVSGHIHLFEALAFKNKLPTQVVLGDGGTDLAHDIKAALKGVNIGAATVTAGTTLDKFGYAVFEADKSGWKMKLRNSKGKKLTTCALDRGTADCGD